MLPKLGAAGCPAVPVSVRALLTWKPVPPVRKVTPRGEVVLKKSGGKLLGVANWAGTPSQLISRRAPVASLNSPLAPATVPPPRAVRNAFTVGRMSAGVAPDAENVVKVIGCAGAR